MIQGSMITIGGGLIQSGGGSSTLVSKTITQNGVYDPADDSADGYSSVTVNVSGGSSPTMVKLWENSNNLSTIVSSITLSDSYANYDFLVFVCGYSNNTTTRGCAGILTIEELTYDNGLNTSISTRQAREGDCYWTFTFSDETILTRTAYFYLSPKEVYGINLGSGITLYERDESDLTTIPSTITLSDDYTNYDYLILEFGLSSDTSAIYRWIVPVSALNDLLSSGSFMFMRTSGSTSQGWNFYVTSTTVFTKKEGSYLSPKAVYGISLSS